jgi:hypothetical protein
MELDDKLRAFDANAHRALSLLIERLSDSHHLIGLARERHIEGHELYGDGRLFEWDDEQLDRARDEELADAIVYVTRKLTRPR